MKTLRSGSILVTPVMTTQLGIGIRLVDTRIYTAVSWHENSSSAGILHAKIKLATTRHNLTGTEEDVNVALDQPKFVATPFCFIIAHIRVIFSLKINTNSQSDLFKICQLCQQEPQPREFSTDSSAFTLSIPFPIFSPNGYSCPRNWTPPPQCGQEVPFVFGDFGLAPFGFSSRTVSSQTNKLEASKMEILLTSVLEWKESTALYFLGPFGLV